MNKFLNNIWKRFQKTRDIDLRNILIEEYLPIVRRKAAYIAARTPVEVRYDDLCSDGVLGLMDAVERFDPDQGNKFETFAIPRISGAIKDGLRDRDYVPRLTRTRHKELTSQIEAIQQKLGYAPHEDEIRKRLRISRSALAGRNRSFGRIAGMLSLDNTQFETDSNRETTFSESLADTRCAESSASARREFIKSRLLRNLSPEDKLILILYYHEGLTQLEISRAIGISESRVSQIHTLLLDRLRSQLKNENHNLLNFRGVDLRRFTASKNRTAPVRRHRASSAEAGIDQYKI